jgi:hypothetical protein
MKEQRKTSKIKADLTRIVINLHAGGYIFDFHDMDSQLVCLQNNRSFPATGVQISIAGHYYDQLSKSFKYVYAIDTNSGLKGLMLSNKSSPFRYEPQTGFPVIESEALTAL